MYVPLNPELTYFNFIQQIACSNELKQCVKESQGYVNKSKCLGSYYKCLKNKGPAAVALDMMEDMGQVEDMNGFAVSFT